MIFKKVTQEKLFQALMCMINWTKQQQSKVDLFNPYSSWSKEYATVRFSVSRQSGHTTFAIKLLTKVLKNSVLLYPNEHLYRHILNDLAPYFKARVATVNTLERFLGIEVEAVIIDCASFISEKKEKEIYKFFQKYYVSSPNFIFIFLE